MHLSKIIICQLVSLILMGFGDLDPFGGQINLLKYFSIKIYLLL